MAHLQAALNAGFVARRDSREREKAGRQGNFVAVGKFCPGIRKVEIVGQPRQNVVTELALDPMAVAGPRRLEGSFVADEDELAFQV